VRLLELAQALKPTYCSDWFHELIAEYLARCVQGDDPEASNLLISTPPGSGKTELVSILFPAFVLAWDPSKHVIALANSDNLARVASGNVLRLIQQPQFQERWPLDLDKATEGQWTVKGNDGRPSMHAAGIMGQITGQRADYLLFDDLLKSQSDAYSEVIRERIWNNFLSAAETRLLPEGRIIGIQTRWHLDDVIGRLLRRAREDRRARQFAYISLAAWNRGEESFVEFTCTAEKKFLPPYKSLASKTGQPYSFSRKQLEGKRADLGPSRWAALYMQNPLSGDDQLFPAECWRTVDVVNTDDLQLVVSGWDCANKTGIKNDYSANVVVGRLGSGGFVVLDVWKSKVAFSELPHIVIERYRALMERYRTLPLLVIEDAAAGTQLLQLIESQYPELPRVVAKPVTAKILRAEGITPLTRGGLVSLLRGEWRDDFIEQLANFPVGQHDDIVDAFCHAMKAFVSGRDFRATELHVMPGRMLSASQGRELEYWEALAEHLSDRFPDVDLNDVI